MKTAKKKTRKKKVVRAEQAPVPPFECDVYLDSAKAGKNAGLGHGRRYISVLDCDGRKLLVQTKSGKVCIPRDAVKLHSVLGHEISIENGWMGLKRRGGQITFVVFPWDIIVPGYVLGGLPDTGVRDVPIGSDDLEP